jgi:rhomboid protease GluP
MPLTEGFQPATAQWEAFALASAASLAPFEPAHIAPKFPSHLLNTALSTYLSLQDDELLLSIVGRGGRSESPRCALTSRRIYWTEKDDQSEPVRRAGLVRFLRRAKNEFVVRVADYGVLPDRLDVIAAPGGCFRIALGGGSDIELGRVDGRLARALASFLETMGRAARMGTAPSGMIDPDLAARAERVLPKVAKVTAQARSFSQDLSDFGVAMQSATPRAFMTPAFTAAFIILYIAMVASGVNWLSPTTTQLVDWGANQGIGVALSGQYWRLLTGVFLHGGLIHIAVNAWSLLVVGPLVERLYGNLAFAFIFLASGVGGSIASLTASPLRVGVGASGAVCGLLGGLVAFMIVHRRAIPKSILGSLRGSLLLVIVLSAIIAYLVPNIDHQAHLGGFVTGFLAGLLLSRPWPVVKSRWATLRRVVAPLLIAGALAGFAYAVAQRGKTVLVTGLRPLLISHQIVPALSEFLAIRNGAPGTLVLSRDQSEPEARAAHMKTIEALIARAVANLRSLRRSTTDYPPFRNMVLAMVTAQSSQLASLQAAKRYLESGDLEQLRGKGGVVDELIRAESSWKSFQEQQLKFLTDNKSIQSEDGPGA